MDLTLFKQNLKNGKLGGIYVFAGEEDYLIRYYLGELRRAIVTEPAFEVFNSALFDGEDVDFAAVKEAIKAPPMMSDYKIVEWRHADISSFKESDLSAFEELIELSREYPYAAIAFSAPGDLFDFGTQKKPSVFVKRFDGAVNILRFDKSTDNQLYSWLKKHFDSHGVGVTLEVLQALVFRSGHSMDVLFGEVQKLSALAKARGAAAITVRDVEEVASSTPECDAFALSNAITDRNRRAAFLALEEMKLRRVEPTIIMGMLSKVYDDLLTISLLLEEGLGQADIEKALKINTYKLKIYTAAVKRFAPGALEKTVSSLASADMNSKFGGVTGYTAIELFISQNI